jgi:predicted transcriptional regulator
MPVHITPETDAKLDELALRTQRDKSELVQEALSNFLAYNQWFEEKVSDSLATLDAGHVVSDEEVRAWIKSREHS